MIFHVCVISYGREWDEDGLDTTAGCMSEFHNVQHSGSLKHVAIYLAIMGIELGIMGHATPYFVWIGMDLADLGLNGVGKWGRSSEKAS